MTYEGCLKVMYENHNKSVARLQAQYEEAIKDSDYFDSESWLRVSNFNSFKHKTFLNIIYIMMHGKIVSKFF